VSGKRIVILFHGDTGKQEIARYGVMDYAKTWTEDGHQVQMLIGASKYVPADVAILHIELSRIPEEYLNFAMRYRVVLNDKIVDIRKSTFSKNVVRLADGYEGPVIAKSDLNRAGIPEDSAALRRRRLFAQPNQYPVFPSVAAVPPQYWSDPAVVVERFLPEREQDLYCVRKYSFVGDHGTCVRLKGPEPIVEPAADTQFEIIEPDPEILAAKKALQIDFGQLDYAMHEGRAVLLDVDRTVVRSRTKTPEAEAQRAHRARGLYKYFVEESAADEAS
jgi:hypothetical protein